MLQDLYIQGAPHIPCSRTCTSQVPLTSLPLESVHPLLHEDLCTPDTPCIPCSKTCNHHDPCSRTCTPQVPITSFSPGPVNPMYPSYPVFQDLYIPCIPHIPCTPQLPLLSLDRALDPGPVHPSYPSRPLLQDLYTPATPPVLCSRTCTPLPLTLHAPGRTSTPYVSLTFIAPRAAHSVYLCLSAPV